MIMRKRGDGETGTGTQIGVISDTHGLLRPEALAALEGCTQIIHAGDVGKPQVLEALRVLAPLHAIAGNIDDKPWATGLPQTLDLQIDGVRIHVLHDLKTLAPQVQADVVISGHSHKPRVHMHDGVLYLNPGSAGPRRFSLPISVATLWLGDGAPRAQVRPLALG
ncbi:phosphodiesterase [Xanthomonas citri pv. fuscans]|uniref:Phosphoesterase n=1 Tax=Xanthomonas citri pv. fuscans TaxID=366649 RepID=A0AB34Q5Q3_XANCI|nr:MULTISPECIES: metallophosphoesterase family protein [Xanthomonas]ATB56728.1 Calcineurin-like phosphoesterase superfamily domain protein [Xanthomonas citri pv. fuscans]ATS65364.1 metallophosphoesterase family protein [Xanthomonas citri pv. phaseoli var. fuscans]ATS67147.1 metallophosphoesterase family protein [Xanthomonas citri pv. phaseoli var. fuscans]ATS73315.1 metallophosphoesterase family protein [Xanthomonas citri pv. phaseoli var. fuscans]ATS76159.1 metallophosphoesterase family prote